MTFVHSRCLAVILLVALSAPNWAQESGDSVDLARQATDPTASLMSFSLIGDYTGGFYGAGGGDDHATAVNFRPAIPFRAFGSNNILRLTIPYQVSGRGEEGLGPVTVFDIVLHDESWGRWAIGAVATMAPSSSAGDKFAIGPAIGAVKVVSKKLNVGLFNQNVFAGDTAVSQLQPVVAYQLGNGWSLSAGDLQFIYDWKQSRWLSVPIGFQIGKVTKLGGQPVRWAINPQYNLIDTAGLEQWSVALTFALLVPSK
jgi:hypothetical protein